MLASPIKRRTLLQGLAGLTIPAAATAQRRDVPFVTSPMTIVNAMLNLAMLKPSERLIDLGSGDGRIVLAAARRGAEAMGVEIDAALVDRARGRAELESLQARARFTRGDLFEAVIRDADVVTLYLLTSINQRLRPKLLTELRPGARIVSHAFDMGDWSPDGQRIVEDKQLFLWIVPAVLGGAWRLTLASGETLPLQFEQRFQRVTGDAGGRPVDVVLSGDRLFLRLDGAAWHGIIGDRTITPDPAFPDSPQGWRAERA